MLLKYSKPILTLAIVIAIGAISFFIWSRISDQYEFRSGAAVVKEMKSLNRLETAQFTIEKIIDAGMSGNAFQNLLFGDRLLFIAHGQVIAGFDLSQLTQDDISISGSAVTITLPQPEIFFVRLDSAQSRVYDRQQGLLNRGDKDLESAARLEAEETIRQAACESGILTEATENGKKQLTPILRSFGFESVTVNVPVGSC